MAYNPLAFGQMLVAMGALVFAAFLYSVYKGEDKKQEKGFGTAFILLGVIGATFGLAMFMNEPIPGHYIEVYGVGYIVFSLIMLAGGFTLLNGWDYRPASYLAFVGGLALLGSAWTIWTNQLSREPLATTAIFALAGVGAAGSVVMTHGDLKRKRPLILLGILLFVVFGALATCPICACQPE